MNMRAFTIDFETTDVDPKKAQPIEVAYCDGETFVTSFIFAETVPVETSAVHHITAEDIKDAQKWPDVKNTLAGIFGTESLTVLVAHNAEYERTILGEFVPVLWVCTYKCALRVWPDAPAHKNEVLRYYLRLGDDRGRSSNQRPHSALHDAKVTWLLFQELLRHASLEQLIEWTEQPAKLPRVPMGKHYGKPWDQVDSGYLQWVCNQTDMREDVKYCAKEELNRRKNQHATYRSS